MNTTTRSSYQHFLNAEKAMMGVFRGMSPELRLSDIIPNMVKVTIEDWMRVRPDLKPFLIADELCRDIKALGEKMSINLTD